MSKSILMHDEQNNLIEIYVYFIIKNINGTQRIVIINKEEYDKILENKEDSREVDVLSTWWRPQTWHTNNRILNESKSYNVQTEESHFDFVKYQQNLIKYCLVKWDMRDEEDQIIEVNEENINALPYDIAMYLISRYNELALEDSEVKKK